MIRIQKYIKFDCAHMLSDYEGLCANLHGHTYHGSVTLEGTPEGDTSMIVDYNEIKRVVDMFDHAIVFSAPNMRNNAETELWRWADTNNMKYVEMPTGKSTAERMTEYIASLFMGYHNINKATVSLSETDGSWATAEVTK